MSDGTDLTIKIKADKSAAQAERRALHEEFRRIDREEISDHEAKERAKAILIKQSNQDRILSAKEALEAENNSWGQLKNMAEMAAGAIGKVGGAMVGLGSLAAVVNEIQANFSRIRDDALRSTDALQGFRERLLELQALRGHIGDTEGGINRAIQYRAQTLQDEGSANATQLAFLGVGESSIGKSISASEMDKLGIEVGRMQAAEKGDPTAYGRLGGMMPNIMRSRGMQEVTAGAAFNEMSALYEIAKPGGFSWSSAVSQYGKAMPYINNGILDDRTAMGILSAYSISEPDNAATRMDQLMRATVGSTGRDRHIKAPEGTDTVGTATYLKGLGVKASDGPVEIARAIKADLSGKGITGADQIPYLQSRGYGNQEDVQSLLNFGGMLTTWDSKFAPMMGDASLGQGTQAEIAERMGTDPVFAGRRANYGIDLANMQVGLRNEDKTNLFKMAYAQVKSQPGNEGIPEFDELYKQGNWTPNNALYGYRNQVLKQSETLLRSEGARVGVDIPRPQYAGQTPGFGGSYLGEDQMGEYATQVRQAGGLSGAGVVDGLVEATKNLNDSVSRFGAIAEGSWGQALQGNPAKAEAPVAAGGGW